MGHLLLMGRLALRDLRRRPGEAVTFLLVVTAAVATLALGLATGNAVAGGYLKTRAATAGPDVKVTTLDPDPSALVARLAGVPGVTAHGGPFLTFATGIRTHGHPARSLVQGRSSAPSAVDQPLVTSGTWVRHGGAVLERGFARSLGVRVGDRITIGGRGYPVVGIAVSVADAVYPWSGAELGPGPGENGGVVWLTTADAHAAVGGAPSVQQIYLKLSDPSATSRWTRSAAAQDAKGANWVNFQWWQDALTTDTAMIEYALPTLVVGGWLLAVAAVVTLTALAVLRAGRDRRRAGLLKAVGAGPGTVAAVLLAQHLLLTLLATALGLAVGALVAPELVDPSGSLLDTPGLPDSDTVVAAVLLAVLIAVASTLGPAVRAARSSTVRTLDDAAHSFTYHPHLTDATAYLPTSLLLGVRLLVRRPGRALLSAAGTAATSIMVTAMLTFRATSEAEHAFAGFAPRQVRDLLTEQVLFGVTLAMVALSVLNTLLLGRSTAVQARRTLTVARTLGATPGQVTAALCVAQLLPAVPGLAVGMPSGLGLYRVFGSSGTVTPPAAWLLSAALAVLAGVGVLTALPAWVHTRTPAGRTLAVEAG